jgi:hypothetical protein
MDMIIIPIPIIKKPTETYFNQEGKEKLKKFQSIKYNANSTNWMRTYAISFFKTECLLRGGLLKLLQK